MPVERELKYSVLDPYVPSPAELSAALEGTPFQAAPLAAQEQLDVYYDDDAASVRAAGLALRRRRLGGGVWACLKAAGRSDEAWHEREEIEVRLPSARDDEPWPGSIRERLAGVVDVAALAPRVELSTSRVPFSVREDGQEVAVVSFDAVRAQAPGSDRSAHFDEVEIEARNGTAREVLEAIAAALDGIVKLTPNTVNKLERAEALLMLATW